jgi:hypothetical protein
MDGAVWVLVWCGAVPRRGSFGEGLSGGLGGGLTIPEVKGGLVLRHNRLGCRVRILDAGIGKGMKWD